eukprot:TRINITY_DN1641_c0_g1_i1.p1 TRINITY_DN1641_c0_g1~~TRINITY_DN1641_c0_g1_i1.p1  ORF type:complete len:672 (+),score=59.48 TRINITY_DN1641_c0_g1_i1:185-2200(+)
MERVEDDVEGISYTFPNPLNPEQQRANNENGKPTFHVPDAQYVEMTEVVETGSKGRRYSRITELSKRVSAAMGTMLESQLIETKINNDAFTNIIRPGTWVRVIYNSTVVLLMFVLFWDSTWGCLEPTDNNYRIVFDAAILTVFFIDFSIMFVTPIYDTASCTWITNTHSISDQYLNSKLFAIDAASIVPIEILSLIIGHPDYLRPYHVLRLLRCMVKLCKGNHYVTVSSSFPGTASVHAAKISLIKVMFLVFWTLLPLHFFTIATMAIREAGNETKLRYTTALYWVVYTVTSVGYGDVEVVSRSQMIWAVILMLAGTVVLGVLIGWLGVMVQKQDQVKSDIQRSTAEMASLLDHYCIPTAIRSEILSFYLHYLENHAYEKHEQAVMMLPPRMRSNISLFIKMKLIQSVPLFKQISVECQMLLVPALEQEIVEPNTIITELGADVAEIFFLVHGTIQASKLGTLPIVYGKGDFFGAEELLWDQTSRYTTRSQSYCDLFSLVKEDFVALCLQFTDFESAILSNLPEDVIKRNGSTRVSSSHEKTKQSSMQINLNLGAFASDMHSTGTYSPCHSEQQQQKPAAGASKRQFLLSPESNEDEPMRRGASVRSRKLLDIDADDRINQRFGVETGFEKHFDRIEDKLHLLTNAILRMDHKVDQYAACLSLETMKQISR